MRQTLEPMKHIILYCFVLAAFAFSHDAGEVVDLASPFKQRIHELCSGHGLTHLDPEDISKLCDLFSENLQDVKDLQKNAQSDKFLSQLTGLIVRANLPKEVKSRLLRESYRMSSERPSEDEWSKTISLLIEETRIVKHEEIIRHTSSSDPYLRAISEMSLEKSANRLRRDENRLEKESVDGTTQEQKLVIAQEESDRPKPTPWVLWSAVGLFIMASIVYLMRRRQHA